MIIDTYTRDSLIESLTKFFQVSERQLKNFLYNANLSSQTSYYFDAGIFDNLLDDFIENNSNGNTIDKIQFFHLGRRLNTAENNYVGKNLKSLLLTDNNFIEFFKEFNIKFFEEDGHIAFSFKNKKIELQNNFKQESYYLRSRFGYYSEPDYCFNGFALKDSLYNNDYTDSLSGVPEFLGQLANFLDFKKIGYEYMERSKYYCFEYLVPIDKVVIDGYPYDIDNFQKTKCLLRACLKRVNSYYYGGTDCKYDSNNIILRLYDDENLSEEYFVKKEEIINRI